VRGSGRPSVVVASHHRDKGAPLEAVQMLWPNPRRLSPPSPLLRRSLPRSREPHQSGGEARAGRPGGRAKRRPRKRTEAHAGRDMAPRSAARHARRGSPRRAPASEVSRLLGGSVTEATPHARQTLPASSLIESSRSWRPTLVVVAISNRSCV
jgi:hypothetical protein